MPLEVGLFGAARVLKNWLTGAAAVMMLQRKVNVPVRLHLNSGRDEGAEGARAGLDALLSLNPNVSMVDVPWLSPDDFRRYLYGMDLLLQPSFTETFNNVTADGCACGVPSVVSEAITWAPDSWKARADSAAHVAEIAYAILRDSRAASRGQKALDAHNGNAMAAWNNWLEAA
jgi:glycosyltransferase involved in cell wall biosynthesis